MLHIVFVKIFLPRHAKHDLVNFRKRSESMKCTREALWNVIPGIGIQHPKVEMAENKCLLQIQDEPQQSPQMIKVRIHDFAAGL